MYVDLENLISLTRVTNTSFITWDINLVVPYYVIPINGFQYQLPIKLLEEMIKN